MKLDFMQLIHNAVFQELSTVEDKLTLLEIVNAKEKVYNNGTLEKASKGN